MEEKGNGAREAVIKYYEGEVETHEAEVVTDYLLAWLWIEGYKVVGIDS